MNEEGCWERLKAIERKVDDILGLLKGKDKDGGLITDVVLLKKTVKDLPSPSTLKFYASIGGAVVMVLSVIGLAVIKLFSR